jgi:hypothetical protein
VSTKPLPMRSNGPAAWTVHSNSAEHSHQTQYTALPVQLPTIKPCHLQTGGQHDYIRVAGSCATINRTRSRHVPPRRRPAGESPR